MFQTEEFTSLTDDQRTTMKWKFLLERCKFYVKVLEHCVSRGLALQAYHVLKYYYTCHIDTTFHEDEVRYQSDSSELLPG